MPTIALNSQDTSVDGARPQTEALVLSSPDAERLVLQCRFVRNQLEARVVLRELDTSRQPVFVRAFPSYANSRTDGFQFSPRSVPFCWGPV